MKPYLKYEDSGIEWIGEIPEHWEVTKLKYSDKVIMGQSPNSDDYNDTNEGLPFLQGNADFKTLFPKPKVWCETANKIAEKEDVLLSVRAPIGAVNIADQSYGIGRGLCAIRSKKSLAKLLFYLALSLSDELNSIGTGSTYTAVSIDDIANVFIPNIPPIEQQTIANYLDHKTHQIDTLIEKKQKLIDLLKEQRLAIINHAVTKGLNPNVKLKDSGIEWLGEIPEHWEVKRLKYIANVQFSNVDKKSYENEEDVFLCNYLDVYNNEFINSKIGFMKATALPREIEKFTIKYGDVLTTKDSETPDDIANAALVTEDFNNVLCGYHLTHIRPDRRFLLGEYLFRLFYAKKFNDQFAVSANGITRYGLSTHSFNSSYISLPSINEQNQIAEYLDKIAKEIDISIGNHIKSIKLLKEYRTALISEAVTGKIDVREEVSV